MSGRTRCDRLGPQLIVFELMNISLHEATGLNGLERHLDVGGTAVGGGGKGKRNEDTEKLATQGSPDLILHLMAVPTLKRSLVNDYSHDWSSKHRTQSTLHCTARFGIDMLQMSVVYKIQKQIVIHTQTVPSNHSFDLTDPSNLLP